MPESRKDMGHIDIVSPEFHADPAATLDRIKGMGAVIKTKMPIIGTISLCTTHEACSRLLKDDSSFVRDPAHAGKLTQARILKLLPRTLSLLALNMLGHDDPEHRRLRGLVDKAFQRRSIETIAPIIRDTVDRLLDDMEGHQQVDLMESFCRDLPLSVICVMLGIPDRDHGRFKNWLGGLKDTANVWAVVRAVPGLLRVINYLRQVSRPGGGAKPDGLIAALRDTEVDGHRLSEDELVSMVFLIFGAGQETTTHLISGGLLEILRHKEQRLRLQGDMSLMPLCVEECLRHVSPVQFTKPRWAARDTMVAGHEIKRGEIVAAFLTAANRDPEKFVDAHRFDICRRPNPHISFGTGIHFCLGFQLARAEAMIAFERILTRFPDVALAVDPSRIVWRKRVGIRALVSLPVKLSA
jgi:cytochrome P450